VHSRREHAVERPEHADNGHGFHARRARHDPLREHAEPDADIPHVRDGRPGGQHLGRRGRAPVRETVYKQVRVGYTTNPSTGKPTRSANHTVRGFPVGVNVYLHFRFQGKTKRNIKVGKTTGPCGIASKRMRLLPTRSHPGTWTVYVDQSAQFHKTTRPQLKYSFVIRRTFG
jgi:hypothetical protein